MVKAKNGKETAPVTYIWCAQTATDKPAIAIVAKTKPLYPKIGFLLNTGITSLITPKKGKARI